MALTTLLYRFISQKGYKWDYLCHESRYLTLQTSQQFWSLIFRAKLFSLKLNLMFIKIPHLRDVIFEWSLNKNILLLTQVDLQLRHHPQWRHPPTQERHQSVQRATHKMCNSSLKVLKKQKLTRHIQEPLLTLKIRKQKILQGKLDHWKIDKNALKSLWNNFLKSSLFYYFPMHTKQYLEFLPKI